VGKRQRHSEFIRLTDAALLALLRDPKTATERRKKALAEAKFRKLRNIQKRSK
jgi:hypothetical protein